MPGFIRRFGFVPPEEVITQIEGVSIIDLPPPGAINGVNTGMVALVGEFADMTYACVANGSGVVSSSLRPQEVFSSQDLIDKFGGFDATLGDFGNAGGSGFVALRNKRYSRLMVCPINLCSPTGVRYVRQLPLCTSQTNPLPVVPVEGAQIDAGREFRSPTSGRLKIGARVVFTAFDPITTGTGGATTNAVAAATQTFTVAGADFSAIVRPDGGVGIKKGDIVVLGNNNAGALQPLPAAGDLGAGTYRVQADATSGAPTVLTLELLTGGNFEFVTAASIPYRIHVSSDADSAPVIVLGNSVPGGYAAADVGGYSIPSRPLTNEAGALTDGTWTAGVLLTPLTVPPALTGSSWDPLSGLTGRVIPTGGMTYVALTQGPNVVNGAAVDSLYLAGLDALISNQAPVSDINVVCCARMSDNIRSGMKTHVATASTRSLGRMAIIRPQLTTVTLATVLADAAPGVGATRAERVIYTWPGVRTFVPEAVNTRLKTADALTTVDGVLDVGSDMYMASILSNLPPENNPGQGVAPVPELMSTILGLQRSSPQLDMAEYMNLRARGIAAPRIDAVSGPIFQSGITTSITSGQKNIARRRMADFIQDSIARRINVFSKMLLTDSNRDSAVAEVDAFLSGLLSVDNPAGQRIAEYQVDDRSGNTAARLAKGIFTIIVRVRTLASADFLVLQTDIGEGVVIQQELSQAA
jgi:hypothetical protein